jgi:hypothetical protein
MIMLKQQHLRTAEKNSLLAHSSNLLLQNIPKNYYIGNTLMVVNSSKRDDFVL